MDTMRPQLRLSRMSFGMIHPDPLSLCSGRRLLTKEGWLLCSLSLEISSLPQGISLLPGQLKGPFRGQAILDLPIKTGLLPPLCSQGPVPERLLTCFWPYTVVIHMSAAQAVISSLEIQDICPHIFLFLAVLSRGSSHTVCTWCYFLWKDEVRLEECFWEGKVKLHRTFFFKLNYILLDFLIVYIYISMSNWLFEPFLSIPFSAVRPHAVRHHIVDAEKEDTY